MTECNNPARHRVADFVNPGADRRFDMIAALRIGKSFPSTPSLDHNNSSVSPKGGPGTRQLTIGSATSTPSVDKLAIAAAI
jgi:hypothetical protein